MSTTTKLKHWLKIKAAREGHVTVTFMARSSDDRYGFALGAARMRDDVLAGFLDTYGGEVEIEDTRKADAS